MATTEATTGGAFPAVNATRELNLGVPEEFPVDPVSSDVATAKKNKEEAEGRARGKAAAAKAEADKCCSSTLRSALVVSGVAAIAIGVAFIVTKKMKNNT